MSLALIVCRCGRRWYQLGRRKWDSRASTPGCPGCLPDPETCLVTGKRRLAQQAAKTEAAWWRRRWLSRMQAYRCRSCGAWHVGNDRPRKPGKARR